MEHVHLYSPMQRLSDGTLVICCYVVRWRPPDNWP